MHSYERHEFSAIYPDWVVNDLVSDMQEHGWDGPPILLYEGKALDGWHRLCSANMADVEPVFEEFNGTRIEAAQKVYRANLYREMTAGQRAACKLALMNLAGAEFVPQGRDSTASRESATGQFTKGATVAPLVNEADGEPFFSKEEQLALKREMPITRGELSAQLGVSPRTVSDLRKADEGGLLPQVQSGELSPNAAAAQVRGNQRDPDTPKPPSKLQQSEMRLEAKIEEIQIKDAEIDEWKQKYEFAVSQSSEYPHEKEATLNQLQAENSALRSSVNEWMTKHNDEKRRATWFKKQAEALGWEPTI